MARVFAVQVQGLLGTRVSRYKVNCEQVRSHGTNQNLRRVERSRYKLPECCLGIGTICKNRDKPINFTVRVMCSFDCFLSV